MQNKTNYVVYNHWNIYQVLIEKFTTKKTQTLDTCFEGTAKPLFQVWKFVLILYFMTLSNFSKYILIVDIYENVCEAKVNDYLVKTIPLKWYF